MSVRRKYSLSKSIIVVIGLKSHYFGYKCKTINSVSSIVLTEWEENTFDLLYWNVFFFYTGLLFLEYPSLIRCFESRRYPLMHHLFFEHWLVRGFWSDDVEPLLYLHYLSSLHQGPSMWCYSIITNKNLIQSGTYFCQWYFICSVISPWYDIGS